MNVADELATVLRLQAPNMGSYVNEAHIREPEYQKAFWGENYDRSLEIKRFSDPYGVFWCPVCVGAEDWAVQDDATVCRVTT